MAKKVAGEVQVREGFGAVTSPFAKLIGFNVNVKEAFSDLSTHYKVSGNIQFRNVWLTLCKLQDKLQNSFAVFGKHVLVEMGPKSSS